MELWDILDENFNKTGRTVERGKPMKPGEYHLVVHIWIKNSKGEYLIQKRTANKTYPLMWDTTGGSAITGDDSLTAALREVKEEMGIDLSPGNGKLLYRIKRKHFDSPDFVDVWLFNENIDIDRLIFQPDEVCDAMWAGQEKILAMIDEGIFVDVYTYLDELFNNKK
ncbi:MAG: NUDIX domain-containing protein [Ignavibacteriae bacterium]|nr:MAG: NUDIX domain-containing protein [Ignavibacteriota bacterium]